MHAERLTPNRQYVERVIFEGTFVSHIFLFTLFTLLCTSFAGAQVSLPAYGNIATVAGDGTQGYSGDNGSATAAELNGPGLSAIDASGNIYIADELNKRIRKVTASTGIITTVAGNGTAGNSGDGGAATSAELNRPVAVAVDANGNIYIADQWSNCIRKVTVSTEIITTVAGVCINGTGSTGSFTGDGGPATSATIWNPNGVALDSSGNIYIADSTNGRIRKVTVATGIITTIAGTATQGYNGDNQPATSAELFAPGNVALDGYGNIYISDFDGRIREVSASTGIITTVAGIGTEGYSGDGGPAVVAEIGVSPTITVDYGGDIFIADPGNNRIREVTNGTINTVAGNGTKGYSGDGGSATSAELDQPFGIALDAVGDYYFSDATGRIRVVGGKLTPTTFNPLYKVVSILYSPPGNQSSQGYSTSVTNGTTTTIGDSFSFGNTISFSVSAPLIFSAGGSIGHSTTTSETSAFTESFTDTTSMTTADNNSATFNPTGSNGVNHHLDTFEIWLNPLVTIESNGSTPLTYTVASQPITVNGVQAPFEDVVGVPAITMEAAPAGVTTLNPSGVAGVTTVPVSLLEPIAIAQSDDVNVYMPGLAAVCTNNALYAQQLAADLASPNDPAVVCTQSNQCGCTAADFSGILQTDPLLGYNSTTYTATPYAGTISPLQADSLATSSGPGSGPTTCGLNAVASTANCRYVVVPYPGTNTSETGSENAVPWTEPLSGTQTPGFSLVDSTTTAETLGGSTNTSMSVDAGVGPISVKVQKTWTWTDSQSVGNSYGSANTLSGTFKSSDANCNEDVSIYEDTVYHTFAFQVPAGLTSCEVAPTITWIAPTAITNSTALSGTQLDATANVPGTFIYSPAAGTILPTGSQTLSVTFTPTDMNAYSSANATVSITVNPSGEPVSNITGNPGYGSLSCPSSITIVGGGGNGATAMPMCSEMAGGTYWTGTTVTSGGSGYTSPPAVYVNCASNSSLTAVLE